MRFSPQFSRSRSVVFPVLLGVLTLTLAVSRPAAAQVGFDFGINDNGALGLRNSSVASVTLNAFTVTFTAPNQTFFDTAPTTPGTASTGFNTFYNVGITAVTLPDDAATDGKQTATFTFSGFDPGDIAGISFDLDAFNNIEGSGSPAGGLVSALFSNGQTVSGIIGTSRFFVPQFDTFDRGVSVSSSVPAAVPEPSEWLTMGLAAASVGGLMFRARRRRE